MSQLEGGHRAAQGQPAEQDSGKTAPSGLIVRLFFDNRYLARLIDYFEGGDSELIDGDTGNVLVYKDGDTTIHS